MTNIFQNTYNPFISDIVLSVNQNKHLVQQVVNQLDKFYKRTDVRKMVLNAFTGSGKTTVSIKALIPEFIRTFYPQKTGNWFHGASQRSCQRSIPKRI